METGSGRSLACIGADDLMRLAGLAAEAEAGLFARHPQGAGRYAGRLMYRALCQGPPCTTLMAGLASRTSMCSPSTPSATMAPSHTGGGGRPITGPRSSAATPVTRRRSPPGEWICSAGPSRCCRVLTRPRCCAGTCLPRGPARRGSWPPKRSYSSVPGRSPGRSSGRPAPRADMLVWRSSRSPR